MTPGASPPPGDAAASVDRRILSLDAVRGLAILMMCLSGVVPRYLPNWMYHGYYPQYLPDEAGVWSRVGNPWAFWSGSAFTWVDWVFPMFLFAMGAAFPLALSRGLEAGRSRGRLASQVLWRGVVLIGFAVYVQQITPHFIAGGQARSVADLLLALTGFVLLFPVLMRLPRRWPRIASLAMRTFGMIGVVALLWWIHHRSEQAFSWNEKDIIILLLAWMAIFGSLLWLLTPGRWWPVRLGVGLGVAFLAHHQAMSPKWRWFGDSLSPAMEALNGWPKAALDLTWIVDHPGFQLAVLYDFTWLKFLWIVIPGTLVGDRLLRYVRSGRSSGEAGNNDAAWRPGRQGVVAALHVAAIGVVLWAFSVRLGVVLSLPGGGELTRSWLEALAAVALAWAAFAVSRRDRSPRGRLAGDLSMIAAIVLSVGIAVEPWEGGIKKGPPSTLSWYLISTALTVSLLVVFVVVIDASRRGRKWLSPLVLNGQNPMAAYAAIRNLLAPVVSLPLLAPLESTVEGLEHDSVDAAMTHDVLGATDAEGRPIPWLLFLWSLGKTLLLAAAVAVMTRARLILRS